MKMVVMIGKYVAQLDFVFPAGVEATHYTQLLKQLDRPVNCGPINYRNRPAGEDLHGLRFLVKQQVKD